MVKNPPAVQETQETRVQCLDQEDPWSWQPTPVFLSGKSHEQRGLAAYSPWDHKESDTTERLNTYSSANQPLNSRVIIVCKPLDQNYQ